jgi:hypothetical protein
VSFLNPLALLGLATVAVPLLLHFFNLRRPRRVDFSSLAFLKELQESAVQRVRIKQWLLLALRILALACLALAFARPTLTGNLAGPVGGSTARTAHALVVDNSLSMTARDGQGGYLAQARQRAGEVLSIARSGDDVFVLPTAPDDEASDAPYATPEAARQAVDAIEARPGGTTMARSVQRAADRLATVDAPRKVVYALSDLQASTWADSVSGTVGDAQVAVLPVGDRAQTNVAVTDVEVASRIVEVGQPVRVKATLANYGDQALSGYVVSMRLGGERVAQATASVDAGTETTVELTATPQQRGWLAGQIEIEDDAFAFDNTRYFTLNVPRTRKLLVVRGAGQPVEYVDLALSREMVEGRIAFQTETIAEQDLPAASLGTYDAVALVGPADLSSGEVEALARYVDGGGGLLFFPSGRARPDDYNALFQRLEGGRFSGFSGAQGQEQTIATFATVDLEHPLFEGVFDEARRGDTEVESPDIFYAMNYQAQAGTEQTLIELSNGRPFLQEVRHGAGRALVLAVAPDLEWSTLPVKGLFIPLLYRSMFYLSSGRSAAGEQLVAGRSGEVRLAGLGEERAVRMVGPEGTEWRPDRRTLFGTTLLQTPSALRTPGVYDVFGGDSLARRVAVNPDARESDIATLAPDSAAQALAEAIGAPARVVAPGERAPSVAAALQAQQTGVEIWNVFMGLALLFLVAEMLVASQWNPETVTA